MIVYDQTFRNNIANLSVNKFAELPKSGKPTTNEWTVLASIMKYDKSINFMEIVALGTGSKCIGAKKMSANGDILNDSHAETICRRAFLRYLYHEIKCAFQNKNRAICDDESKHSRIFIGFTTDNKLILNQNITFHFFVTHMPCGDAAIFSKQLYSDEIGTSLILKHSDKKVDDEGLIKNQYEPPNKKIKVDGDTFRTGAKCLHNDSCQDLKKGGNEYHSVGLVRTKPGRGDPTLSVSCSDKLAKWTFVGIQGALLSFFLEKPIYLNSITIAGGVPFSADSLLRALKRRFLINSEEIQLPGDYQHVIPVIGQADNNCTFIYCKSDQKRPCPSSIVWSKVCRRALEVSVDGKKQGVTKKNKDKKQGRLLICKKELFGTFMDIATNFKIFERNQLKDTLSYSHIKNQTEYKNVWEFVKTHVFKIWTHKEENLLNFTSD